MDRPDTNEMVVVHRAFRREFRLACGLVGRTEEADRERAGVLAGHIEEYLGLLHHHHTGEDELLWPKLTGRSAMDFEWIQLMADQHEKIAKLAETVRDLLPEWRESARAVVRDDLARALGELSGELDEHLRQEEGRVLPLAAEHLSVAEWNELGERGLRGIPKRRLLTILGAILEEADERETAIFIGKLPPPARLLWRLGGPGRYRREVARIRG